MRVTKISQRHFVPKEESDGEPRGVEGKVREGTKEEGKAYVEQRNAYDDLDGETERILLCIWIRIARVGYNCPLSIFKFGEAEGIFG